MLKYKELVSRLTEAQKLLILSDISSLSRREFRRLGLPELKNGYVDGYLRGIYPSASTLANSWNDELVGAVATDILSDMYKDGVELAVLPSPRIKLNPYGYALSEDPCLSTRLSREYLKASDGKGISACINGYAVKKNELEWLDREPNDRVIHEYFVKPYADATAQLGCAALMADDELTAGEYKYVNESLMQNERPADVRFSLCERAGDSDTVRLISSGTVCLNASRNALENALRRYEELKHFVDKGELAETELLDELALGNAISPDTVDQAVERVFDFITSCREGGARELDAGAVREKLSARAIKESAVLLKNDNTLLPLSRKEKIFVIGDIKNADGELVAERIVQGLQIRGYNCIGFAQGYELSADRSDMFIGEAYNLSEKADKIILLLGRDAEREGRVARTKDLELPANQVAMAKRLAKRGRSVLAVVSTDNGFDIDAVEGFDAVMLMELCARGGADALADIVSGAFSPSGKLASSLYRNTDASFGKQRQYRKKGSRAGVFVGYRYYDSAGCDVGFPFGHGIGYSEFLYSRPRIDGNTVKFTLKNVGKYDATETVQMYVGLSGSSVIRPKKELVAYTKVTLKAGESRHVTMEISLPKVYDASKGALVCESGVYTVYVGASVSDVRFSLNYRGGDTVLKGDGEDPIDYLQSASNIVRDKYTLEANYELMKRTVRNIISGVVLLLLAVLLRVYCHSNAIDSSFLNIFSIAITLVSAGFFIMEVVD